MLKVVVIVVLVIVALIAILLIVASRKPNTFRITRSVLIKAKADRVFALIDDFHAWRQWSPWEDRDPNMSRTYGPTTKGQGATYAWSGNNKIGAGRMEITDCAEPHKLLVRVEFIKPMQAVNTAEFTLEPEGDAVKTTWAMFGPKTLFSKVMGVFFSMDAMVGKDFEKGLADLKAVAERAAVSA